MSIKHQSFHIVLFDLFGYQGIPRKISFVPEGRNTLVKYFAGQRSKLSFLLPLNPGTRPSIGLCKKREAISMSSIRVPEENPEMIWINWCFENGFVAVSRRSRLRKAGVVTEIQQYIEIKMNVCPK